MFENNYLWNENRVFNSPWTVIIFHVIFNFSRELFDWTVGTHCATEASFSTKDLRHVAATNLGTRLRQPTCRKQDRKQALIHTGFHRFTEIGQIFYSTVNKKNFPSWNLENGLNKCFIRGEWNWPVCRNNSKTQEEDFRELKSKTDPGGAYPRTPRSFEACLGNRSVLY